ncbi:hypothetical protein [Sphingobacterium daejeonense]|uniref:hypothetical protein n=1 Tax=Sphingobacterium daejeonense TaxID=371142 RepID=UPI0010C51C50|nr:hypothetical protein [Sphingobacterium daejeonense]VTQ08266.1 Uncharacterised protein [Sphingobacterium daejeonense]
MVHVPEKLDFGRFFVLLQKELQVMVIVCKIRLVYAPRAFLGNAGHNVPSTKGKAYLYQTAAALFQNVDVCGNNYGFSWTLSFGNR